MKALILAAGFGSRLKSLTKDRPKCLVPVHGRPIIDYQLEALLSNRVTEVGIVLGYQGQKIIDFIAEKYPDLQCQYFWSDRYHETNSSYSFWVAHEWIMNEWYLHLNCDILFSSKLNV